MKIRRFWKSGFILLLAVFINLNLVDDRFVSPLEDLDFQYQSYELEETTRVLSSSKESNQVLKLVPSKREHSLVKICLNRFSILTTETEFFTEISILFFFLYLPPPFLA
ncbi:hypothetical protein EHQ96_13870 [Leptospira levettii]|uniref:Uncharacterized protein n=2 Tax=Leptospira TaxID=171 RepID=A0ABY2MJG7_9LEPT|nr:MULTISPECIES: hypothetical protein [Leptospira]PKA25936.1 hypothetical protein CH381_12955 [Leptospira sp. mixed culture ATI2-C-A1]MBL0954210.1 hypothetical protein [Leptospira sp.]MCW7462232.1 hypothetical protein [Leptospira limi]MCW7495730.1 hypothetical protein [Leptospira levettii]PJZ37522.1 hypothetical protein CH354_10795 [Leptospira levettii]